MTCYSPIAAYKKSELNATGKRSLQFRPQGSHTGIVLRIPCGNCPGCRLERSRTWAVRCMHEKRMHKDSCFVTLTYDNEHLPEFGNLVPRHLQLFHKRLHNRLVDQRGYGIRYYGCGEYGDLNKRPHYHTLLFGFDPIDKVVYSQNARGESIFTSRFVESVWHDVDGSRFGDVKIGEVSFESAAYVARYCMKKAAKVERERGHYIVYDGDGQVFERTPEFPVMSRRPGIGSAYFDKYGAEIMAHDSIIMGNREVPSIRYYDLKIEALDPARMKVIRRNRLRKSKFNERQRDRMRVKEILLIKRLREKERKL